MESCFNEAKQNWNRIEHKQKSKKIIPIQIVKRKWTVTPIQWCRCEFEIQKHGCDPVNISRWEHSSHTSTLDKITPLNDRTSEHLYTGATQ